MIEIRLLDDKQTEEAFSLIWEVFLEFVAPDYTQEGIDNFYQEYVHGAGFRNKFTDRIKTRCPVCLSEENTIKWE